MTKKILNYNERQTVKRGEGGKITHVRKGKYLVPNEPKSRVIVEVQGGRVAAVYAAPNIANRLDVDVMDYDFIKSGGCTKSEQTNHKKLEKEVKQLTAIW